MPVSDPLNVPEDNTFIQDRSTLQDEHNLSDALNEKGNVEQNANLESQNNEAANQQTDENQTKDPDPFAPKFAALSRKEKQVREREQALQTRIDELEAKETERSKKYSGYDKIAERFKTDPLELMKEHDLTFEQLTQMVLDNDGKPTTDMRQTELEKRLMGEIDKLKGYNDESAKKVEQTRYDEVIEDFVADLTDFVNDSSEYELIKAMDQVQLVYNVIEQHHIETGRILSKKEACDKIEEHLLEDVKRFKDLKKVKDVFGIETENSNEPETQVQPSPTLSNTQSGEVPNKSTQKLSNQDSLNAAAKILTWND